MRPIHRLALGSLVLLTWGCITHADPARPAAQYATAEHGMIASTHPLATQAGLDVLKAGGNAVDAAVAVALTLGVVDGHNSGIGGGCFMMIRKADGQVIVFDGREMAPAAATRDMFIRDGKADTTLSQNGPLASGVPGALAVYDRAIRLHGRKTLADVILPAAQIAEEGFPIDFIYARKLNGAGKTLATFPEAARILLKPDGSIPVEQDVLRQPDLAASYRAIAKEGADWFYRGDYARRVAAWMRDNGGLITETDFANYVVKEREPFSTTYRGYTVINIPPPSSGGVHVAQMLNILENFDLKSMAEPGLREHVMAEAMKLAFADRAYWLGDPDFVDVPKGLADKSYAKALAAKIDLDRATPVPNHGTPPDSETRLFEKHTTHFSVADAEGNWVACTATINTAFGSKVIVPGTGILLNNQMDDFSIEPGVPNHFKLIGAEANAIAPGKRPLSCMSPTIVLDPDGKPFLAIGAAGGPTIITQVLQNLVRIIDLNEPLDVALAGPRVHQQWQPDQLRIERGLADDIRAGLAKRGHQFFEETRYGVSHIVGRTADGKLAGASDPRAGGAAAGY